MKTWKILGGIGAALIVAIAAFFAWIQSTASRRWAELEKKVPLLIAEARGRDPRRPPRAGEPGPGNAWTDYNQALAAVKPLNAADLGSFVARQASADRAKALAAVAAHEGALAFVTSGARKGEGTFPFEFEKGFAADIPGLLQTQNLSNLAVSKARLLLEGGKAKEAGDLLLDILWLAADQGRNTVLIGEMMSSANMALALEELRALAVDEAMKDVDWPEVARVLALLDGTWPSHAESMLNEAVSAAAGLLRTDAGLAFGEGTVGVLGAWRFGFSMRLMIADALDTHIELMRRVAEDARSYAEAEAVAKELDERLKSSSNPIVRIMVPGLASTHRVGFERRAQLRLLRMAVARRLGQALELEDPFGGKLRGDAAKLWSVGQDGVDGGGVGAWRPARTGDIVLQLQKDDWTKKK